MAVALAKAAGATKTANKRNAVFVCDRESIHSGTPVRSPAVYAHRRRSARSNGAAPLPLGVVESVHELPDRRDQSLNRTHRDSLWAA